MRNKSLHSIMFGLLLMVLFVPSLFSQPTSNFILTHDTWNGAKIYTVDIYLQSTAGSPIELAVITLGLQFPDASRNGGTITGSYVAGSSELTNTTQINTSFGLTQTMTVGGVLMRKVMIAGKTPPGTGGGSMIATGTGATGPGTRIGTLRLVNTADWVMTGTNHIDFQVPGTVVTTGALYPCSFNAYVAGLNTNITSAASFQTDLSGPLLPVELSSFASVAQGRTVVLNWSTKTEKNSDRFEVERSIVTNGNWSTVGSVKASVLSNSTKNYSYTDTKLQSGKYQYRLKMVDNDGSYSYSSVEAAEVAVPKDFAVSQNYPNPFNPSTKIDYQVPVDAKVVMEVYNIAGQKVMELVNQEMSAGYYTVDFGASKLSSGVYIYRLAASDRATGHNFSSIKKMMLLK